MKYMKTKKREGRSCKIAFQNKKKNEKPFHNKNVDKFIKSIVTAEYGRVKAKAADNLFFLTFIYIFFLSTHTCRIIFSFFKYNTIFSENNILRKAKSQHMG